MLDDSHLVAGPRLLQDARLLSAEHVLTGCRKSDGTQSRAETSCLLLAVSCTGEVGRHILTCLTPLHQQVAAVSL